MVQKVNLTTKEGLESFFEELPNIRERRFYKADLGASDLLMDFDLAVRKAKLSKKQNAVIHYLYTEDLTQTETAKRMSVVVSMVFKHKERALEKITKVFSEWGYNDEVQL